MTASSRGRARGGKQGAEPRSRIRARQRQVVTLADQGWTQQAIAADVGISQAAVSKILSRVDGQEAAAISAGLAQRRARQVRRLEHLRREALQAWVASKAGRTRRRQRKTETGGVGSSTAEITIDEQAGDPRLLDQVRRIEEQIAVLYGFDRTLPSTGVAEDDTACTPEELTRRLNALAGQLHIEAHARDGRRGTGDGE